MKFFYIGIAIIFVLSVAVWYYIFNIADIKVIKSCDYLNADPDSKMKIEIVALNALGKKVPFRNVQGKFEIFEGKEYIEVVEKSPIDNFIIVKSNGQIGQATIKIYSKMSFLPILVEIPIIANVA